MRYKPEEPPQRTVILHRRLADNNHQRHSSSYQKPLNTPVEAEGKILGYLRDHTFAKRVQGSKHMVKKPPAWCVSREPFCEKVLPNTRNIIIIDDLESGLTYECPTQVFAEHAFEIQRGSFEPQLALTLSYWERHGNGRRQLELSGGNANVP